MIEGIISWSIPGMQLDKQLLDHESDETRKAAEWKLWGQIYHRHLISEPLNPIYGKAGVVFFALCTMAEDEYAILFIDYLTKACNFAPPFAVSRPNQLVRALANSLDGFKRVYGHPIVLFCMNPCQGSNEWLGGILQRSVGRMAPSTTPVTIYQAPHQSLPHRIAEVFESMHDASENCQESQNDDSEDHGPSWDMAFAVNMPSFQSNSFMQHTSSGHPEPANYLWSAALPGPVTKVNEGSWSRIDFVNPFSGATFGPAVAKPLSARVLRKITDTMLISRYLPLSSDVGSSKTLRFDQISRNLVTYLVLRKQELVPKRGAGTLIGRVRKRARNTSREDTALSAEQATRTLRQLVVDELDEEEAGITEDLETAEARVQRLAKEAEEQAAREEAWMKAAKEAFENPAKLRQAEEAEKQAAEEEAAKEEAAKEEAAKEEAEQQTLVDETEKHRLVKDDDTRSASRASNYVTDEEDRSLLLEQAEQQERAAKDVAEKHRLAEQETMDRAREASAIRDYKEIADQETRLRLLKYAEQHRAQQKMADRSADKIRTVEMKRAAERERLQAEWRRKQAKLG